MLSQGRLCRVERRESRTGAGVDAGYDDGRQEVRAKGSESGAVQGPAGGTEQGQPPLLQDSTGSPQGVD